MFKQKKIKESERIVNISELIQKIQFTRIELIELKNNLNLSSQEKEKFQIIIEKLFECENFEFVLERINVLFQ